MFLYNVTHSDFFFVILGGNVFIYVRSSKAILTSWRPGWCAGIRCDVNYIVSFEWCMRFASRNRCAIPVQFVQFM